MQFTILRQNLKSALDNVRSTVKANNHVEWSKMIKFNITPENSDITAYDLEVGAISEIDAVTMESTEFLVEPDKLAALVSKMTGETIECDVDNNVMTMKCGRSKVKLPIQTADNFPSIPSYESADCFTLNGAKLAEMIRQTVYAVAQTDNKPVLRGELFEISSNVFNLAAIDGHRLAVSKTAVSTSADYKFVVKGETLKSVAKLAKDADVTVYPSKKHTVFDFGRNKIFTRLIEGDFVNYRGSIPENSTTEVKVNVRQLAECLERFSLLIDSKTKAPVKCTFRSGTLDMSINSPHGEMQDYVDIDFLGNEVTIGFNVYFLLDALKASETDKVKLCLNSGLSPMKILPAEGNDFVFLVLPVRLKD